MVHRKTVRHFHEVGHLHELTFSCYRRMPLLTNDTWREKLAEYIHHNPVRRGLCRRAVDWKWSSARYYLDPAARQHPSLPTIHGLPEGAIF